MSGINGLLFDLIMIIGGKKTSIFPQSLRLLKKPLDFPKTESF